MQNAFRNIKDKWKSLPATTRWLIYYAVTLIPNVICIILFRTYIQVTVVSVFLGLITLAPMAALFDKRSSRSEHEKVVHRRNQPVTAQIPGGAPMPILCSVGCCYPLPCR